jgi:hypothetical protein
MKINVSTPLVTRAPRGKCGTVPEGLRASTTATKGGDLLYLLGVAIDF